MDFFFKHKIILLRTVGALALVIGFAVHFWVMPKEGISENEMAAANLARLERQVKGSGGSQKSSQRDNSRYLEKLRSQQEKQIRYLTILAMLLGVGFLGYSFLPKKES